MLTPVQQRQIRRVVSQLRQRQTVIRETGDRMRELRPVLQRLTDDVRRIEREIADMKKPGRSWDPEILARRIKPLDAELDTARGKVTMVQSELDELKRRHDKARQESQQIAPLAEGLVRGISNSDGLLRELIALPGDGGIRPASAMPAVSR